ncbi:response regulator receiver protein [Chloroherpeton thalassium ATCC 35110]|uniref:Response regulator receiver protein n=1 Tax=Chloroherpeton thalassium (strain ATCC 35110 / GB-78) TaxID=517418 RepID=B3QYR9_CHLT3|nr:response regulator [Chloroherpeton thalassium]ACF15142.1 response regulator receiver protein [Chloroherpeton thalassium ATCC 35110]
MKLPNKRKHTVKQLDPVVEKSSSKILLVDDDDDICKICQRALSMLGYEVLIASCGETALQMFKEHEPEIILLDIFMPDLDGFDVLRSIRSQSDFPEVILITGYGDMNLVISAMRNGATDFLTKPFDLENLRSVIDNARKRLEKKKENQSALLDTTELEPAAALSINAIDIHQDVPLRIRTFGNLIINLTDKEITSKDWHSNKTEAVFKLLLINHKRLVTTDEFIDKLWPDARRRSGEVMLYTAISSIRYLLEPQLKTARKSKFVFTHENGYELNLGELGTDYLYDADLFESYCAKAKDLGGDYDLYKEAVELYSDDFLKSDTFEEWTFYARESLKDQYLAALQYLAEHERNLKNYRAAAIYARKMVEADNLSVTGYELLIEAYLNEERIGEAMRIFKQCKEVFQKELNMPVPQRLVDLLPR